jgi:hypothetical protein
LEVLDGPAIESPCFPLRHAKDDSFEVPTGEIGDGVFLRMRAEDTGIFLLEFAKDSRALRTMEDVLIPSEGSKIGQLLSSPNESLTIGAKE